MGEYVAACFSGVLSLENALVMVIKRAELMQELPNGAMMSVEMPSDKIKRYLSEDIDLAAVNSPASCVISGNVKKIEALLDVFEKQGVSAKLLHISHAAHSVMMEPILTKFTKSIENIEIHTAKIPYISNLTGKSITQKELNDKNYWSKHIRGTVQFSPGINEIISYGDVLFIEVGPGHALSNFAREHFEEGKLVEAHQLIRHSKVNDDDFKFLLNKIADLWRSGVEIDWIRLHTTNERRKISLPTYSFEDIRYPVGEDVLKVLSDRFEQTHNEKRLKKSDWYYEPTWKKSKLPNRLTWDHANDLFLVFHDEENIGNDFILPGLESNKVISIRNGDSYRKINDFEYVLNPYNEQEYSKLFSELKVMNIYPDHIIHMLSLDTTSVVESIQKNKTFGFYSILYIAKELNKFDNGTIVNLSVITNNMEVVFDTDLIQPSKSLLSGLLIVISQENPLVKSKLIDITFDDDKGKIINDLLKDIKSGSQDKFIAYRKSMRWVKTFNRLEIQSINETKSVIKSGGTYLITGGLGGLGFTYSKYLLEKYNANLVLIGRGEPSSWIESKDKEKKDRLEMLQSIGKVSYHCANISNLIAMREVIKRTEVEFGFINGVIHTAAVTTGDSFSGINFLSVTECEKQFDPKINGTLVIEELFRDKDLDFCLLTSSLASIIGGKEFGAYAPASTYLDYFSQSGKIRNCLSVNFGSLYFNDDIKPGSASYLQDALDPYEIPEVLEMTLSMKDSQILVSPIELEPRIKKWIYPKIESELNVTKTQAVLIELERANLSTVYSPPSTETEKETCSVFELFFGIVGIGIDDNFFELGGNSLKAMTLISHIHKKYGIQLKIKDIFEDPNIRDLSKKVDLMISISQMNQSRTTMNLKNKIKL